MKQISKLLILFSIIFSVGLLPLISNALGNDPKEINNLLDADKIKIENFIKEQMDNELIPGISIAIVQKGETIYQKGFGYSDIESKKPVTSESLFEIGSNSKAFTALGILNLQNEGLISLEDEVTKYIPWLIVKYQGKEVPITLEELLHHTSGIPFKTIDKLPISNEDNALEETVKNLINIELDSNPGEWYQYATINYDVLGLVIQNVTGSTYEEYIEKSILKPMGLNNTYLFHNESVDENLAQGYKLGFLKPRLYNAPVYRGNKPAGYILSSAEDMAKWLKIQMGNEETSKFSKALVADSHIPNERVEPRSNGSRYAAGWFILPAEKGGETFHGGNNPSYSSFIVFRPESQIGIAVLSNTNSESISVIARGINDIMQNKFEIEEVTDMNKRADRIAVIIIIFFVLLNLWTLYSAIIALKQIFMKEREFVGTWIKNVLKVCFSFIFMLGLSYCIYMIPYIAYSGVTWGFVFVWLPGTVKTALYLVYIGVWLLYTYVLLTGLYKKKNRNFKRKNTIDLKQ